MDYKIEKLNIENVEYYARVNALAWKQSYKGIVNDDFLELINTEPEIQKTIVNLKEGLNDSSRRFLIKYNDVDFILELKELCFKWYIEIIYGWNINIQREKTIHELDKHIGDMRIIQLDNKDVGVTTFYEEEGTYVVGLIIIHPNYQNKGIATNIIKEYIDTAKNENKRIIIKPYKQNPAKKLYERLGFRLYKEDETHVHMYIDFSK